MTRRRSIPRAVEADILDRSRRRCAICYAANSDPTEKRGQIAHLDRNPRNNDPDNLLFLCLEHHDEYDSTTSQSKGLSTVEVRRFRDRLYKWVELNLPSEEAQTEPPRAAPARVSEGHPAHHSLAPKVSGNLVGELAADWGMSKAEVRAELERVKQLLERVEASDLPSRQLRLLEILIGKDKGDGLPRRVVEVAAGYDYLSREFFDEMSVLTHFDLASYEPEDNDIIYLNSHETWMSIIMLCERHGVSISDLLRNPDPAPIM